MQKYEPEAAQRDGGRGEHEILVALDVGGQQSPLGLQRDERVKGALPFSLQRAVLEKRRSLVTTDVIIQRLSTGLLASGQKIQVRDIESEVRIAITYTSYCTYLSYRDC